MPPSRSVQPGAAALARARLGADRGTGNPAARVSIRPDAERSVDRVLSRSRLVRVAGALPARAPGSHPAGAGAGAVIGYVAANADGADGDELTDYDLIGDARCAHRTVRAARRTRASIFCACRRWGATPMSAGRAAGGRAPVPRAPGPADGRSAAQLGQRPRPRSPASSQLAVSQRQTRCCSFRGCAPLDRLRGSQRAVRSLRRRPPACWRAAMTAARRGRRTAARDAAAALADARLQFPLDEAQRRELAQPGVNCFDQLQPGLRRGAQRARTLLPETAVSAARSRDLPARRLSAVAAGLHPRGHALDAAEQRRAAAVAARARAGRGLPLDRWRSAARLAPSATEERYFVICDERLNTPESVAEGRCRLLFGLPPGAPASFSPAW